MLTGNENIESVNDNKTKIILGMLKKHYPIAKTNGNVKHKDNCISALQ